MQTKKRARPIKFGTAPTPSAAAANAEKKVAKPVEEPHEEAEQPSPPEEKIEESASLEDTNPELKQSEEDKPSESDDEPGTEENDSATITEIEVIEEIQVSSESAEAKPDEKPDLATPSPGTEISNTEEVTMDKNDDYFDVSPDSYGKKNSLSYFFSVTLITFIVGFAFFLGIYYAVSNRGSLGVGPSVEEATPAVEEATPTVVPVDLSAYSIQVLNGSGVSGQAARTESELVNGGFKVASVGNADRDNYTNTQIRAKENVARAYLDKLSEALKNTYNVDSEISKLTTGPADVEIVIGSSRP